MAHMPAKDSGLWAAVFAWLVAHQPQLCTGGTAAVVAMCRVIYGGGGRRKVILEGTLCGRRLGGNRGPDLGFVVAPSGVCMSNVTRLHHAFPAINDLVRLYKAIDAAKAACCTGMPTRRPTMMN